MKKILSMSMATILAVSATACGDKKEDTLKTASMFGGTDPTGAYYQDIIKNYEDKYGVTVEDVSSTADETWKTSILADFQVGNEPDVLFYFTGVDAQPLIEAGKVVDIETIRVEYPDYGKDISAAPMEFMVAEDGKTYALPIRGFWEGLFVNADLFEEYGVELPTDWEKFENAVDAFSGTDIVPVSVSFGDVPHYWIEHLILSYGGYEEHRKTLTPGEPAPDSWVEALNLLTTLNEAGAFSPDATATNNDAISQLFKDKKAAMMIDGSWFAGGITDQENTIVMPFPAYPTSSSLNKETEIIGGFSSGFYITTKAWEDPDKREQAVNFVMEMTSADAIAQFAKVGGAAAAEIELPTDLTPLGVAGLELSNSATKVEMPIDASLSKEAWDYIVSNISNIVDGSMDARDVLDKAAELNK